MTDCTCICLDQYSLPPVFVLYMFSTLLLLQYPPSVPLMVVLEELQPYSKVTFTDIHKDELKAKV